MRISCSVRTVVGESSTGGPKEQAMPSLLLRISLAFTLTAAFVARGPTPTLAQGVPNLSRFDHATRQSLELACILSQSQGPAAYGRCLNNQIDALKNSSGVPDLSRFDYTLGFDQVMRPLAAVTH
jgi:hypothetical protein